MTTSMVRTHKDLGQYFILRFTYQDVRFPDALNEALFVPQT